MTPTQFGIPNERPRYYCVATRGKRFDHDDGIKQRDISEGNQMKKSTILTAIPGFPTISSSTTVAHLRSYLSGSLSIDEIERLVVPETLLAKNASWCMDIVRYDHPLIPALFPPPFHLWNLTGILLLCPDSSIPPSCSMEDTTSSCFTKAYSTYFKGTFVELRIGLIYLVML